MVLLRIHKNHAWIVLELYCLSFEKEHMDKYLGGTLEELDSGFDLRLDRTLNGWSGHWTGSRTGKWSPIWYAMILRGVTVFLTHNVFIERKQQEKTQSGQD
jgi:hypothetical protein|tara:strand:+ start:393 stop:695 length:303 start_codon:yes stop_codon:yes gene_type:complete